MPNILCETLGIRYPIILGGMARVGTAPLVAAVSNAGGLGLLGAGAWRGNELREQILRTRELTDKVFGVNISLRAEHSLELVETVIEERIRVVSTSAGDPRLYTARLKENGVFVMHVVSTVDFAIRAENAGVDAVIAEGSESGGSTGREEISTLILIPQVVDAVSCPVIAAGGIGNGRGMAAVMTLGAVGIQMGTVFMSTEECEISQAFKELLVMASESDTQMIRYERGARRIFKEKFFEQEGANLKKDRPEIGATLDSDVGALERGVGQVTGLIKKIRRAGEVVEEIMAEAQEVLPRLRNDLMGLSK